MTRARLAFRRAPAVIYAVGDVHGCLAQLRDMQHRIVADAAETDGIKWIVMLGDYVDRGPDAAGVIAHLLAPPPTGFERICLLGNHEQVMLDFLDDPVTHSYWLSEGGLQTLASYGIDLVPHDPLDLGGPAFARRLRSAIPAEHLAFLRRLPIMLSLPGWLFVHAGIRPGLSIDRQEDEDLIWIREPFLSAPFLHPVLRIVHGHTPTREPVITPQRIGIDTRCFSSGRLTALRIRASGETALLTAQM